MISKESRENESSIHSEETMKLLKKKAKTSHLNTKSKGWCIPVRYVVTIMGCWGFFNIYAMRVNLSVALVAMINDTSAIHPNIDSQGAEECESLIDQTPTTVISSKGAKYNWDSKEQSLILGAFFYGYVLTQLPGGTFAEKFGAKWLFGGGVLVTAILSLLTPLAASWGTAAFLTVRVLEGLGEGVTMPAMNALISRWAPTFERSILSTFIFTGCQLGNVIAMPVSGILCTSDAFGGWPSVFYVFGAISCFWFLLWIFLVYETPADHPNISSEELFFIQENQGEEKPQKSPPVPWKRIFTSVPVWALTLTHFGHSFGFLMLLTELPSYLSKLLHFNIKANGILSAVPYLVQALTAWTASYLADRIRKSGRLHVTTIRRLFNSIGLIGPAICLIAVTVSGCQPRLIVGLISLAMATNGFTYAGYNVTHVDMSPDFAGTLYGITNTVANLCGILGPAVVGIFTSSGDTLQNWNNVFYLTAGIYVAAALLFAFFGTAELQPWGLAKSPSNEKPRSVTTLTDIEMNPKN